MAAFMSSPTLVHQYAFAADVGDLWRVARDVGQAPECQPLQPSKAADRLSWPLALWCRLPCVYKEAVCLLRESLKENI